MIDLKNKVIMISGANRGIGYATAKLLKEKGCILSLAARNSNDIKVGGDNVLKCTWDAKEKKLSNYWVSETISHFGKIDGLVMNAGVELGGDLEGDSEEEFDEMFEVNFKGP